MIGRQTALKTAANCMADIWKIVLLIVAVMQWTVRDV